jgi:pimeloyl-ACP methyl ester carboxylesterase
MKRIIYILLLFSFSACGQERRPQEPVPPFPYKVEEVRFENVRDGASLAGTLTIPENGESFPAVILVSGSGLQDRDETVYGHKPFLVLADFLTKNGIVVLRYDERSIGGSSGKLSGVTSETFAYDAYAGIKYLKTRDEVDTGNIGLIGHSEGGMIGTILAGRYNDIAFFVSLAGPGIPFDQVLISANEEKLRRQGKSEEIVLSGTDLLERLFEEIKKGTTSRDLARVFNEWRRSLTGEAKTDFEEFYSNNSWFFDYIVDEWATPWSEYAINFDPREMLAQVKCPVFALNGKKDSQVLANNNLPAIEKALKDGGNENFRIEYVDDVNHLFQKCKTGFRDEYESIDETFNEDVMMLIAQWINQQTN